MKRSVTFAVMVAALLVGLRNPPTVSASDRVGIYALVDKVVLEPSTANPQRIQIWGTFALALPNDLNAYQAPRRGYLYFTLPFEARDARTEWEDIVKKAGSRQAIAFANRFDLRARVRAANEKPSNPEPYPVSLGVIALRSDTQYTPIRSLLEFGR
jgi:hypothetical protein